MEAMRERKAPRALVFTILALATLGLALAAWAAPPAEPGAPGPGAACDACPCCQRAGHPCRAAEAR
jgi:hypothetical protein